ncbi:MAG TPA: hypothetical protein DEP84_09380 [Chloroflexi bacterium]|nr:hypothetical protein [Chloroflexota bacterium]
MTSVPVHCVSELAPEAAGSCVGAAAAGAAVGWETDGEVGWAVGADGGSVAGTEGWVGAPPHPIKAKTSPTQIRTNQMALFMAFVLL